MYVVAEPDPHPIQEPLDINQSGSVFPGIEYGAWFAIEQDANKNLVLVDRGLLTRCF